MGKVLTHGPCHGICRALGQNVTRWCAELDLGDGIFVNVGRVILFYVTLVFLENVTFVFFENSYILLQYFQKLRHARRNMLRYMTFHFIFFDTGRQTD